MADTPPRRRHVLKIEIGADSAYGLADLLEDLAREIDRDQLPPSGTSGGVGRGYTWSYSVDPTVTHESYERDLRAWCDAKREEKDEPAPLDAAGALLLLVATFTDRMPTGEFVRSTWWKAEDFEAIATVTRGGS